MRRSEMETLLMTVRPESLFGYPMSYRSAITRMRRCPHHRNRDLTPAQRRGQRLDVVEQTQTSTVEEEVLPTAAAFWAGEIGTPAEWAAVEDE